MLLGKHPGPPIMRRTTSMSDGLAVDTHANNDELMSDSLQHDQQGNIKVHPHVVAVGTLNELVSHSDSTKFVSQAKGSHGYGGGRFMGMGMGMGIPLSPTTARHTHNHTANTNTYTSHFLLTCGLCKCRLAPGRDIYMYRGDTAFCSLECREKQMKQEQRKEKLKAGSGKEHHRAGKANTSKTETTACN